MRSLKKLMSVGVLVLALMLVSTAGYARINLSGADGSTSSGTGTKGGDATSIDSGKTTLYTGTGSSGTSSDSGQMTLYTGTSSSGTSSDSGQATLSTGTSSSGTSSDSGQATLSTGTATAATTISNTDGTTVKNNTRTPASWGGGPDCSGTAGNMLLPPGASCGSYSRSGQ